MNRAVALLTFIAYVFTFIPISAGDSAFASNLSVFSKTYIRETGKPQVYTDTFNAPTTTGSYTLIVHNGKNGQNRVSSARIWLNDKQILGPSDFNQQVDVITRTVTLKKTNTIKVELMSKPGSFIFVNIIGEAPAILGEQG